MEKESKIAQNFNEMHPVDVRSEKFNVWDPRVIEKIDDLVKLADSPGQTQDNRDLVREMIVTALKAQHAQLDRGDAKILSRSLRELRYGFRVFNPYRHRRKVTIFGSARTPVNHPEYKLARDFAKSMAKEGFMVITGAGAGIMRAGNEGAGPGNSFGVNIRLPFEQEPNEFIAGSPLFIDCRFFFTRKLLFLKSTNAVAAFPGGLGTFDEGLETLTLVQTGKCDPIPIVLMELKGTSFWQDWQAFIVKHLLKKKRISAEDIHLFKITSSVDEAVKEITRFYHNYHSMRFVNDELVVRVKNPLSPEHLEKINKNFSDIAGKKGFRTTAALSAEIDNRDLPRLVFHFQRVRFGRLRQLVDFLNLI